MQSSSSSGISETSETTQQLVDQEVRRLTDDAHRDVTELLSSHREQLENLAAALLEVETLGGIDAYRAAGLPIDPSSSQRVPQSIYDTL